MQSVKYLLARGTSGLPFGKKCNRKTVYCCDGHCALGAHQPLGDGHTSARSGEPKRDPKAISQSPESTGCYLRGSQRKTIHFHVLDASSNSSSAHFSYFWSRTGGLGGGRCHGNHEEKHTRRQPAGGMTGCAVSILGPFT